MTSVTQVVGSELTPNIQTPVARMTMNEAIRLPRVRQVSIRPAQPGDIELIQAYVRDLSPASCYFRFLGAVSELPATELHRATNPNASSGSMVLESHHDGMRTMIGEARWHIAANGQTCEIAASVTDAWQRQGFGTWLLNHIAARVRSMGARYLLAEILHANKPAQRLVRKFGFHALPSNFDPKVMSFIKELEPSGRSALAGAKPI